MAGLLVGGAVSGVAAAIAGGLLSVIGDGPAVVAALATAGLMMAADFGLVGVRLPQNARQVPQTVIARGPIVGSLQFGFEMGTGARTYVTAAAPITLAVAAVLIGSGSEAVAAGLAFGAGRAVATISRRMSGASRVWDERLVSQHAILVRASSVLAAASVAILAVLVS